MTTQSMIDQGIRDCGICNITYPAHVMYDDETCLCCYCAGQEAIGAECVCPDNQEYCAALVEGANGDECMRGRE